MSKQKQTKEETITSFTLNPDFRLPLIITSIGLASIASPMSLFPSIAISLFGFFLLIQTFTLRLEFTDEALVVNQLGKELRRFPFSEWLAWRLFLPQLPGILYFREEASPHLLPILFNPSQLQSQLRNKVGNLEKPKKK